MSVAHSGLETGRAEMHLFNRQVTKRTEKASASIAGNHGPASGVKETYRLARVGGSAGDGRRGGFCCGGKQGNPQGRPALRTLVQSPVRSGFPRQGR